MEQLVKRTSAWLLVAVISLCTLLGLTYVNTAEADEPAQNVSCYVCLDTSGGGSLSVDGLTYPSGMSATFDVGDTINLTATPDTGHEFVNWTVNGVEVSTSSSYTYTVNGTAGETITVCANFKETVTTPVLCYVRLDVAPEEGGTFAVDGLTYPSGMQASFDVGDTINLSATANAGYTFVNWTVNGAPVSESEAFTYTVDGADHETIVVCANFKKIESYMVNIGIRSVGMGNITINGESKTGLSGYYDEGTQFELTAEAVEGYTFVSWTNGSDVVSTDPNFTYTVAGRTDLYANFEKISDPVANPDDPSVTDPADESSGNTKADENDDKSDNDKKATDFEKDKDKLPKTADTSLATLGMVSFFALLSLATVLVAARRRT